MIKAAEKNPKAGLRKLADEFKSGKTQISTILRDKERILDLYEANASGDSHSRKRKRTSRFSDVNDALYEWYCLAKSKDLYPDGPLLMEKAKEISEHLGFKAGIFKASNGWLECWKKQHNIRRLVICGESGDISGETVTSWKERVPEIVNNYAPKDVWNLDETGLFWRALPEKGKVDCDTVN